MTIDPSSTETSFLPGPRDTDGELQRQVDLLAGLHFLEFLRDIPEIALVLNRSRQIVWLNRPAASFLGEGKTGSRLGEALLCVNADRSPSGCGTTEACAFCGAALAMAGSLSGLEDAEECVIQRHGEGGTDALNLKVWSKPFEAGGQRFVYFMIRDISLQKRHEVLERIFYHDIGNSVSGIKAMAELLAAGDGPPGADLLELMRSAADQLAEEIESQRSLKAAESGTLRAEMAELDLYPFLVRIAGFFKYSLFSRQVELDLLPFEGRLLARTDPVLLRRVVLNMLKNALEASSRGERIRLGLAGGNGLATIWVWNATPLGPEAMHRVFQRSYSTKGKGRGLGTYSMKVLAERYLGASVSFRSSEEEGTVFEATLPAVRGD